MAATRLSTSSAAAVPTRSVSGPSTPARAPKIAHPAPLSLHTTKHSHFLDLSETEGIRTPRPATLTPSPPMRTVALPRLSDDDAAGGYTNGQHHPQSRGKGKGSEGRGNTGMQRNGKEGLPWSVDAVTNGPAGEEYFAEGSGSGSKKHHGGGLFGLAPSAPSSPPPGDGIIGGGINMNDGDESDPAAEAGKGEESDSKARQAVCRTRSTRSVLGRGGGRVEPEEEGEAARLLRTIDFAARVGASIGS